MITDARGLHLTGSAAAVAGDDQAIDDLIRFRPEVVDASAAAVAADPGCAMAAVFAAYLALMSTEEGAVAAARATLDGLRADAGLLPRERAHLAAASRWVAGDMTGAGDALAEITVSYPGDLLALFTGHQIDFFTGNAVSLRDRIGRALGGWPADHPQLGFVHGMYAFGLEECNLYQQSEEAGQRAVERNPDDVWGIHAVVHTYEMAGRIPDGVRYLRHREADWTAGNFLNVHNSWHYALYLLQGGDTDGALAVYDRMLHHEGSEDVALELLDATALLWRMHLEGAAVGHRWPPLAAAWGRLLTPGYYPFNDMHAVMAFIGNGQAGPGRPGGRGAGRAGRARRPGQHWRRDDGPGRAAGLPRAAALRPGRVRPRARRTAAGPGPGAHVRRQSRAARRGGAHAARSGPPGRAAGAGRRPGQRAAVGPRLQHLRLV